MKINEKVVRRPQYVLRVLIGIHMKDIDTTSSTIEFLVMDWGVGNGWAGGRGKLYNCK
jgi:hypothetical protein